MWKGISGIRDFTKKTLRDSGFDRSWEADWPKLGTRGMGYNDKNESGIGAGMRDQEPLPPPPPPLPDPGK